MIENMETRFTARYESVATVVEIRLIGFFRYLLILRKYKHDCTCRGLQSTVCGYVKALY